jgi:hypothetical protein
MYLMTFQVEEALLQISLVYSIVSTATSGVYSHFDLEYKNHERHSLGDTHVCIILCLVPRKMNVPCQYTGASVLVDIQRNIWVS